MARNDGYRRYLEAAAVLGEITRARAEELVRELMSSGDDQRAQAQEWMDELMGRSRKAAGDLLDLIRGEVTNQLQALGLDPDDLARQAADILRRSAAAGKRAVEDVAPFGAKEGVAKDAPDGKKGAPKAPASKKSTAKKATAKKATAKKATAKKATAKKATAKKATAKKATAKKSPAKTSSATPAASR